MSTPETWTQAEAEGYAATYASLYPAAHEDMRRAEALREQLRRWMELHDCRELVDGETGRGVELERPATQTSWDTRSMPAAVLLSLKERGVLTVATGAFDALRRAGGGPDLDEAQRYRLSGEKAAALKVVTRP